MMKENKFKSREEQKLENNKQNRINTATLVVIILFLVFLVTLVIIVRRNIEISEQKKPAIITISAEKKEAYPKNSEIKISSSIIPDDIDSSALTWYSSNEEVAKFEKGSILKALSIGQTVIYAELSGIKSNELNIVIANYLEDVNIDNIPKQIEENNSIDLDIKYLPADSINTDIKIESSNDKIISVREKTLIAQKIGNAKITIKDSFNNIMRIFEVNVIPKKK